MNEKELRIGNFVFDPDTGKNCKVSVIDTYDEVYFIKALDKTFIGSRSMREITNGIKQIELTEETLFNFSSNLEIILARYESCQFHTMNIILDELTIYHTLRIDSWRFPI